MQQHLIAQNYPGLLDGIIPGASYPDTVTLAPPITDCSLLARAIENSAHDWTDVQKKAVSGFCDMGDLRELDAIVYTVHDFSPASLPAGCSPRS